MAIDSSIYRGMASQTPDIMGAVDKGLRMRDLMDQRKERSAISDAFKKHTTVGPDGKVNVDRGLVMKDLYAASPEAAMRMNEQFQTQDARDAQMQANRVKSQMEKLQMSNQLVSSATDQNTWTMSRNKAIEMGLAKPNELPEAFDPKFRDYLAGATMTQMERLNQQFRVSESERDQKNKELDRGLKRDELDAKIQGGEKLKITGDQAKAAGFANRIRSAESVMEGLEKDGFTGSDTRSWVQKKLFQEAKPVNLQKLEQAQRNFINAVLRRESGAAISGSEFDSANLQYFPQRGDSPEVLEQKRQNRLDALASLEAEAGPGLEHVQRARERIAQDNTFGRAPVMTPGNREINILPKANAAGGRQVFKTSDIEWAD